MDLAMPVAYQGWDPLLQRYVVASDAVSHVFRCPSTPASSASTAPPGSTTPATPGTGGSAVLMPPPPPRISAGRPSSFGAVRTPDLSISAAPVAAPQTPAEAEAQSLALAFQLQQEEHAAFMHAVRVSSPAPGTQPSAGSGTIGGEPMMDDEMDESLQLAMQLQQEELQWHAAASGAAAGIDAEDEDMRLAMRLAAEQDDGQ